MESRKGKPIHLFPNLISPKKSELLRYTFPPSFCSFSLSSPIFISIPRSPLKRDSCPFPKKDEKNIHYIFFNSGNLSFLWSTIVGFFHENYFLCMWFSTKPDSVYFLSFFLATREKKTEVGKSSVSPFPLHFLNHFWTHLAFPGTHSRCCLLPPPFLWVSEEGGKRGGGRFLWFPQGGSRPPSSHQLFSLLTFYPPNLRQKLGLRLLPDKKRTILILSLFDLWFSLQSFLPAPNYFDISSSFPSFSGKLPPDKGLWGREGSFFIFPFSPEIGMF